MEPQAPYKIAHFRFSEAQSTIQTNSSTRGKSCTYLICKLLFFVVFISVIPLFPSQAPDFINQQSVMTKFWELIHLLFIGIAVSYGLFCRRNVDVVSTEIHSRFDNLQSDMSKMFHVSSNFEDGYEDPYGSAKKRQVQSLEAQYFKGKPRNVCSNGNSNTVIDERFKTNMPIYEKGIDNSCDEEYSQTEDFQTWNSQYFLGKSLMVVAQPNYDKPLGLPVRSLKSRLRKVESHEFIIENGFLDSIPSSKGSSECSDSSKNEYFGDSGPKNLDLKFNEVIASPFPMLSRSISQREEMKESLGTFASPSHFSPTVSVDETQFESLKTQSLKSKGSFSSQASASSMSSSPPCSFSSSELLNSSVEDWGTESFQGFSASGSSSSPKPMNDCSFGSSCQNEVRGSKDNLNEVRTSKGENQTGSKELKWERKNKSLSKASSRGKSVRTIRSGGLKSEVNDDTYEKKCDNVGTIHTRNKSEGMDSMTEENVDNKPPSAFLKPTHGKHQNKEMKELSVSVENAESNTQTGKFVVNSEKDAASGSVNDAIVDSDEVDKKAGEFIAKFREQMRLQKVASFKKKSSGLQIGGNYI